jgi:class 3 adenylate cyclase
MAAELPEGEVSFLFSDVEGSTKLLEGNPALYGAGIARHHELLEGAVETQGGVVFETIGDAVYAAFADAGAAVDAAVAGQAALLEEDWGELGEIRVRMAVHTGPVERRGPHYFGPALYRCARLMATAHGGQVVLSQATAELVRETLRDDTSLLDLGQHRLKDMAEPERVHQLVRPPLRSEFPELRSAGGRPNNLPAEVKTFVGRREELAELEQLLVAPEIRLVTLTGPGGSGKTRLALRAAGDLLDPFRDGVFLVGLTPLDDAALVLPAIAQTRRRSASRRRPVARSSRASRPISRARSCCSSSTTSSTSSPPRPSWRHSCRPRPARRFSSPAASRCASRASASSTSRRCRFPSRCNSSPSGRATSGATLP